MRWLKKRHIIIIASTSLLAIALVLVFEGVDFYNKRIIWTKFGMKANRENIAKFKNITGRFPASLSELKQYATENSESELLKKQFKEYLSDRAGNSNESNVLNDKGGWYYDKNLGETKVNLKKPIKHYLKFYFGEERNEIPSDW
jgi:cell shape-determining protein MreC